MIRYLILLMLMGCGTEKVTEVVYKDLPDNPNPVPEPDTEEFTYQDMQRVIDDYCIACHGNADFTKSETELRNSEAADLIFNYEMPPPGANQLPDDVRTEVLRFLG